MLEYQGRRLPTGSKGHLGVIRDMSRQIGTTAIYLTSIYSKKSPQKTLITFASLSNLRTSYSIAQHQRPGNDSGS